MILPSLTESQPQRCHGPDCTRPGAESVAPADSEQQIQPHTLLLIALTVVAVLLFAS